MNTNQKMQHYQEKMIIEIGKVRFYPKDNRKKTELFFLLFCSAFVNMY